MTEERVQGIRRVVCARLARFGSHPEWEDLLQSAWIDAWQAVERHADKAAWTTLAWNAAGWSAIEFFRAKSLRRSGRLRPGSGRWMVLPAVETVPLQEWSPPAAPDHAPVIIGTVFAQQLLAWAREHLARGPYEALVLVTGQGMSLAEAGVVLGISKPAVQERHRRAVAALAAHLGDPERQARLRASWRAAWKERRRRKIRREVDD